jgi:hypothetical protein
LLLDENKKLTKKEFAQEGGYSLLAIDTHQGKGGRLLFRRVGLAQI